MNRLQRILENKKVEVAQAQRKLPESALRLALEERKPARTSRSLIASLQSAKAPLIAEFKRRSPSAGALAIQDLAPVSVCSAYEQAGAAGVSVLTDPVFFSGTMDDLQVVAERVSLPVLRKDFILDPYQVYEARLAGADAVLLIAECLDPVLLRELSGLVYALDMEALVEVHNPENIGNIPTDARLVGINHRDLSDFSIDLKRGPERLPALRERCPQALVIAESGIGCAADARHLMHAGFDGLLVGSLFMRQPDPAAACALFIREWLDGTDLEQKKPLAL